MASIGLPTPIPNIGSRSSVFWAVLRNLLQALLAVLAGNAIYFLLLSPLLPPRARHAPTRLDLGLLIDFWVCVAAWGALHMLRKTRTKD